MIPTTEAQTLRAILDYLTFKGVLFIRLNPTKPFTDRRTGALRFAPVRQGQAGAPDIVLCQNGRFVGLEVKSDKGRLSPSQAEWQSRVERAGGTYHVIRSVDQVIQILDNAS